VSRSRKRHAQAGAREARRLTAPAKRDDLPAPSSEAADQHEPAPADGSLEPQPSEPQPSEPQPSEPQPSEPQPSEPQPSALTRGAAGARSEPNALRSPTTLVLGALALLVAVPYVVPGLERLRLLAPLAPGQSLIPTRKQLTQEAAVVGEATIGETAPDTQDELRLPENVVIPDAAKELVKAPPPGAPRAPRPIEDPSGAALDAFFEALYDVEQKKPKARARITYYGDSIVATDYVTGTLRRRLQRDFGDAGHGFVLVANGWPGYFHNDIDRFASSGWQVSRVVGPYAKDGFYGLGGVSFKAPGPGVLSRFGTSKKGSYGKRVKRFVLSYLEHPEGGTIGLSLDGGALRELPTKGAEARTLHEVIEVDDGAHELEVRGLSAGARLFGVSLERDEPGVIVDAIGIQGARLRFLDQSDDAHWATVLGAAAPSLVAFQYSINEVEDGEVYPLDQYEETAKAVLAQVRRALPKASCLVIGPLDRVDKRNGAYVSRPVVPKLAAAQRRVAHASGCGYWDTLAAMGGPGSMGTWVERRLGGADLAHPSSVGAEVLGGWVHGALLDAYDGWKRKKAGAAAPSATSAPSAPTATPSTMGGERGGGPK
jgi:lysophospholipase L1-like esterase